MGLTVKALPFTFAAHLIAIAASIMVLVWCVHFRGGLAWENANKNLIFNIHPVLTLIGFIVIGGEAIITYKSLPLKKPAQKLAHLILHGVALVLGIIGSYTALKYHNEIGLPNMYTLHSWLGIIVICLYAIQWIYGLIVFFYPGGSNNLRKSSLPWHALLGIFIFILAIGTTATGFAEKLTVLESVIKLPKYGSEALLVNFMALITILYEVTPPGVKEVTIHEEKLSACPSRKVYHSLAWETSKTMASHTVGCRVRLTRNSLQSDLRQNVENVTDVSHNGPSTTY
ncbi:Transmembrane ascorbate ferrireductase 1 [Linum perenne]